MRHAKILAIGGLLLLATASASLGADKFTCKDSGESWSFIAGDSPVDLIVMWDKSGTDCDIYVETVDLQTFYAIGHSSESRFEKVSFGPLAGDELIITVIKFGGGKKSKAYLRGQDDDGFLRNADGDTDLGLVRLGDLEELAAESDFHARSLQRIRALQEKKRSGF